MDRIPAALRAVVITAGYLLLAVALSWPLARDFATYPVGDVHYDARHAIWVLWYTAQAFTGAVSWPWTTHLLFPHGISLLVDGVGPLNALVALPFWPWGPAAAFNGTALAGLALSGPCLYLLARHLALPRGPAFVAGALYMVWPIHLIALFGHLEKLFTGLLPLTLLAGLVAFDWRRTRWRTLLPAVALLGALLQNGNQFVFAALGLGAIALIDVARAAADERGTLVRRIALTAAVSLAVCAPLLTAIAITMRDPSMAIALGDRAAHYSPDLLGLVLPSPHQWIAGPFYPATHPFPGFNWPHAWAALSPTEAWYGIGLETAITIPLTAAGLIAMAWRAREPGARTWIGFGVVFTVLALGPWLRVGGVGTPVPLPYLVLTKIPGLDVMRTPGRFMLLASIGLAIAAGFGLAVLARRWPARMTLVTTVGLAVALGECWPRPWPQSALPPVPAFARTLAAEPGPFAVLDLPHGWHNFSGRSSAYMLFQTTHGKPIGWSYLSRYYSRFPNAGLDGLWHAEVREASALRRRLQALGYRYVIWHRHAELFEGGRVADGFDGTPRGPGRPPTDDGFIREAFAGEPPVHEDALVVVFRVEF